MRFLGILFFCLLATAFFGVIYFIYFILKAVFAESLFLGLLFVFFGLPIIGRLLFFVFFSLFSTLLSLFFMNTPMHKNNKEKGEEDEVIDVKYKILK